MTRRLPLAAALVALLLTLAACGSDDPSATSGEPSPTVSAGPTEEPSPEPSSAAPSLPGEPPTTGTSTPAPEPTPTELPSATPTGPPPEEPQPTKAPPEQPSADDPPTTYAEAQAHFDRYGQEPRSLARFISPDQNLYCVIDPDYLPPACEIDRGAVSDPDFCGNGPTMLVGRIEFADGDPRAVCNSDTIREPGARTLRVGEVAGFRGTSYQCLLEDLGLTCLDANAPRGFFLTRGQYEIFTS